MQSLLKCSVPALTSSPVLPANNRNALQTNHVPNHSPLQVKPSQLYNPNVRERSALFPFNLQLQLHVNAGSMGKAHDLFDKMPERTLISWTILMSGYARHGPAFETLLLFRDMLFDQGNGVVRPDSVVYAVVLRACGEVGDVWFGREVHGHVLKRGGRFVDGYVESALVNLYASCGLLEEAVLVFDGIKRPDLVAWSSMISGYVKNGLEEEGLSVFLDMVHEGMDMDPFAFSTVIRACATLEALDFGRQVHCCLIKKGLLSHLFLDNCLLDFYAKCGDLERLRKNFHGMCEKDLVSWNTLIMGYVNKCEHHEALSCFRFSMDETSCCDDFTISSVLKAVSNLHDFNYGREVHGYALRVGLESSRYVMCSLVDMYIKCVDYESLDKWIPLKLYISSERGESDGCLFTDMLKWCSLSSELETGKAFHSLLVKLNLNSDPYIVSSLIDMYSKFGILDDSLRVFRSTEDQGTATWSAIITSFCRNGWFQEVLKSFRKMQFNGILANEFTINPVIQACLALGNLRKGKEVHCRILKNMYEPNISVVNMLVNLYSELWHHKQALKLCSMIPETEVEWNVLIRACLKAEDYEMLKKILRRMQLSLGNIDLTSMNYILSSCRSPVLLSVGTQVQAYMTKTGHVSDPLVSNSLIRMYSDCGEIASADQTFRLMSEKSSLSWTSIISGKVEHGISSEALALFFDMRRRNKSIDSSTLKSVLKASAQVGWVDEAQALFMSMEEVYGIERSEEHYSCMVAALAQAGMFEEAQKFINEIIPEKVGATIWRALLSSARAHGKMEVAKHALEKLLELDPNDVSVRVLHEQVLFMLGDWKDTLKAEINAETKLATSSWIEVGNRIYEFVYEETPSEVLQKLAEMEMEMEELGYRADRNYLLHDAEEEKHHGAGLHHTEMKAIAFGLFYLPHGKPVRVVKSVRMCGTCHSACKFMSTFIDRELVVKDTCTFHHFKDGKCSCRDFW